MAGALHVLIFAGFLVLSVRSRTLAHTPAALALLVLHGLFGSGDNWFSVFRPMSDRVRAVLPDLAGRIQVPAGLSELRFRRLPDGVYRLAPAASRPAGHVGPAPAERARRQLFCRRSLCP